MADENITETSQPSYLGMSDAEILNEPMPEATPVEEVVQDEEEEKPVDQTDPVEDQEDKGDDAAEDASAGSTEGKKHEQEDKDPEGSDVPDPSDKPKDTAAETDPAVNFEAEYKRLLAPFKANGRDIAVKNVDDAIALMQMGANYNKKMAAIKPNLKLMKMLENNGLMSEEKIGFLIDLDKKNPEAISKLVKDSGVDPMDLDTDKASGYKQTAYTVDDRELELDTVLSEIEDTPTYTRTLDIVSNKWDVASKQVIAGKPELLKVINTHVERGIYDLIIQEVENERVFGRLSGLSDLDAYRQVGDAIQARGGFNHLGQGSSPTQGQSTAKPGVVTPKPKKVDEDELKNKRRAASSTKPAVATTVPKDFNPLGLSDEAFSKLVNEKFL